MVPKLTNLFLLLFALLLAGCSNSECSTNTDCESSQLCVTGRCVDNSGQTCGANQPCANGEYCCGNVCGAGRCCVIDAECSEGWCNGNRCQEGTRPRCTDIGCEEGVCDTSRGVCVECTQHGDCDQGEVCGVNNTCVQPGQGCTPSECAAMGKICSPQEGCRDCIPNTSDCGNQVCAPNPANGNQLECMSCDATSEPCPGGLTCVNGRCEVPEGQQCSSNADCTDLVCKIVGNLNRCQPCVNTAECGHGFSCHGGKCSADVSECTVDANCTPPTTVCNAGKCVAGCVAGSCAQGFACDTSTGRCYITGNGTKQLGEACTSHSECRTGACWRGSLNLGGPTPTTVQICSQPCMGHNDCPWVANNPHQQAVCWELGHGNMCIPKTLLFNAPYPSLAAAGNACNDVLTTTECRTGYCHTPSQADTAPVCMDMCGRDGDCAPLGQVCVSGWPVGFDANADGVYQASEVDLFTQLCHGGWGHLGPNMLCGTGPNGSLTPGDQDRCLSGWCALTPDFTEAPRCAEPCCTPNDCDPTRPVCKPIDVWDGVREASDPAPYGFQKMCLPAEYANPAKKDLGEPCLADHDCKSEICASASGTKKVCTQTCCTNDDCAGFTFAPLCRIPYTGGDLNDTGYAAVKESLGRQIKTGTSSGNAPALTTLCLPP